MKTHTIEDIRRLVPEAKVYKSSGAGRGPMVSMEIGTMACTYTLDDPSFQALLTTRAQLEVAVNNLNRISMMKIASLDRHDNKEKNSYEQGLEDAYSFTRCISSEGLNKIEEIQQCEKH